MTVDDEPALWESDVVAADGATVHVRPIRPDDGERLVAFHERQSPESIYYRFFSPRPRLSDAEVRHFTNVDHVAREAFVVLLDGDLIGVARYDRYRETDEAEVAFFIDDAHHGRGLAPILLEYLAAAGRTHGIGRFVATVLPTNRKMLAVFKQAGFDPTTRFADGVIEVSFEVAETGASQAAAEGRATGAEVRTVARLLEPRTVAVVGAGRRPGTIGHEVLRQLLLHEFTGPVYPVNREALHVASVPAWPSVLDVPEHIDLAVVAVPAEDVLAAVEDCARARVGSVLVVSAGFAEVDEAGLQRERELVALARRHGIRVLGPASLGVVNTDPEVRLHATFAALEPRPGRVALSLQSGTLGVAIVGRATELGLGFSSVVAVGAKVDVSGNDLLAWWEADDRTDVVVLSLESFGNPRRFRQVAPRVARRKPVVALVRGSGGDPDLLLGQTGVVGVDSVDELLDVARLLAWQPVPAGRRVAVIADSAGAAEFTQAAGTAAGLLVTATALGLGAGPAEYGQAVAAGVANDDVDAVLVVYTAPLAPRPTEVAEAIAAVAGGGATTVVTSFPGHAVAGRLPLEGERALPNYE
nr:GNAT family N-acetyltransferase [Acidimicrobiia bacterium]